MKRLMFYQNKDKTLLFTDDVFCSNDFYTGNINLLLDRIEWIIYTSNKEIAYSGNASSVSVAKIEIKKKLLLLGAKFEREHRKYKI